MARIPWMIAIGLLVACGDGYPVGAPAVDPDTVPDAPDTVPEEPAPPPPVVVEPLRPLGPEVLLVGGDGLTSHALTRDGASVLVVATRDLASPRGTFSTARWTRVDATGRVEPEGALELYYDEPGGGLVLGAVAVSGREGFLAMSSPSWFVTEAFELVHGDAVSGGQGGLVGPAPARPFHPSTVPFGRGFLAFHGGWGVIEAEIYVDHTSSGFIGSYRGHDPHVVNVRDRPWLGWNDEPGARVAPLIGTDPPLPRDAVDLGPASNGPVLAAGPDRLLALTWGDTLEAHLVSPDPPSLAATATVATGAISGRPAAIPWSGGFLVIWADASGTTIRGRRLDATGAAVDPGPFTLLSLAEPVVFEPTHAIADDTGGWLTWVTTTGLYGARLSLP